MINRCLANKSIYLSPYIAPVYKWRTEMDCELNIYKICDNLTPKFILFYFYFLYLVWVKSSDQHFCLISVFVYVVFTPLLCPTDDYKYNEWARNVMWLNQISYITGETLNLWYVCLIKKSFIHVLLWHCYQNTWTHKVHFQFHKYHQSRHTTETDESSTFHSCLLRNALIVFLSCLLQTFYKCFLISGGKN